MKYTKSILAFLIVSIAYTAEAQTEGVSIKSTVGTPDPSAMLEISHNSKGVLFPRVTLQAADDATTIPNPAHSLMVFNLGSVALPEGYYYNDGPTGGTPNWVQFSGGANSNGLWTQAANETDIYRETGNVAIGKATANASAILDMRNGNSDAKGVIFPFNLLSGANDVTAINNPASFLVTSGFLFGQGGFNSGGLYINLGSGTVPNWRKLGTDWQQGGSNHYNDIYLAPTLFGNNERKVGIGTSTPQKTVHIKANEPGIFLDPISSSGADVQFLAKEGSMLFISQGCAGVFLDSDNSPTTHASEVTFDIFKGGNGFDNSTQIFSVRANGEVRAEGDVYSKGVKLNSDSTLKSNITSFDTSSLFKVKQMRPVHYTWKNDAENLEQTGFIAQEIRVLFPELVSEVEILNNTHQHDVTPISETKLTLNYIGIIPHLVKAMQEQQDLIEALQAQNAAIIARLEALEGQ